MIDAKKFPKAAQLQKQREEKFEREQARLKEDRAKDRKAKATKKEKQK
jgi:hypothetical protein